MLDRFLPDPRPEIIKRLVGDIHYLHFGCILFVITLVVTVVVSLLSEPMDKNYVIGNLFECFFQNDIHLCYLNMY